MSVFVTGILWYHGKRFIERNWDFENRMKSTCNVLPNFAFPRKRKFDHTDTCTDTLWPIVRMYGMVPKYFKFGMVRVVQVHPRHILYIVKEKPICIGRTSNYTHAMDLLLERTTNLLCVCWLPMITWSQPWLSIQKRTYFGRKPVPSNWNNWSMLSLLILQYESKWMVKLPNT